MNFEGSEKKVELSFENSQASLRKIERPFWDEVVKACKAQILSQMSSECCDAYLLSESSLFVFDHRVVMITCGTTDLVQAVLKILEFVDSGAIESLIYERKNEVFPHLQPTSFYSDVEILKKIIPGRGFRFGKETDNHVLLFHSDRKFKPHRNDMTVEILMHGVTGPTIDVFSSENATLETRKKEAFKLHRLLPEYQIDDYFFEPVGYSLNALKNENFYTIHATPQETGSYVSFESNYCFENEDEVKSTVSRVIDAFQPEDFAVMIFSSDPDKMARPEIFRKQVSRDYLLKTEVGEKLECGYQVGFYSYFQKPEGPRKAVRLKM